MTQTITFKIIGITDDSHICECCGKKNLKKVVVMENIDTGSIVRYGTDCAAKAMRIKKADVDYEFDIRAKVALWIKSGHSLEVIYKGLGNRGYGATLKDGKLYVRGIKEPIM